MLVSSLISLALSIGFVSVSSQTISTSDTFNSGGDDFDFSIEIGETMTTCTMTGPSGRWIGIGFGGRTMAATYSVNYDTTDGLHENVLEQWNSGTLITPCNSGTNTCAQLVNATDDGSRLTVVWERENDPSDRSSDIFFVFDNTATEFEMIWAFGAGSTFANHGPSNRGSADAEFEDETTDPQSVDEDDEFDCTVELPELDMTIFMRLSSTQMEFELTGPEDRWFGIGWNGHFDGDALLYTTGADGNEDLSAYDCSLSDQSQTNTNNGIDSSQDWQDIEVNVLDESVNIKAYRALSTGDSDDVDFEFPPPETEFYFVHGSTANDYQLRYHGSGNYERLDIDLITCTAKVVKNEDFSRDQHGLLMMIAFAIFMPWSALINRFLGFSICAKISFLRQFAYLSFQLHKVMMIAAWVFALMGFITIISDAETEIEVGDRLHDTLGLITFIMMTLMTFGTLFGNIQGKITPRHTGEGDIQAINGHRLFGAIFILFGLFVCMNGIVTAEGQGSSKLTFFLVYVIILILLWVLLEVCGCMNTESMDKRAAELDETLPIVFGTLETQPTDTELVAAHSDEVDENNQTNTVR